MTYVLVSLVGDDATAHNEEFLSEFVKLHPPAATFRESHPNHADVGRAARELRTALIFGHDGGGSLRAHRQGALPWCDAAEFAGMFSGSRVWVFACDTRSSDPSLDAHSFGRRAFDLGVSVFVGHCEGIGAILPPGLGLLPEYLRPRHRDWTRRVFSRAFRSFLRGQNEAQQLEFAGLRVRGIEALNASKPVEQALQSMRVLGPRP